MRNTKHIENLKQYIPLSKILFSFFYLFSIYDFIILDRFCLSVYFFLAKVYYLGCSPGKMWRLVISLLLMELVVASYANDQSHRSVQRIDCYPERESPYSSFSKEACLTRNCLFDDNAAQNEIPCYLKSNYGYILDSVEQETDTGIRLRLKRNQIVASMFPEPIENALLDIQYYTNDIVRFKLYDADNQRYEVCS